jgi:FkbM family methyltransferase
LSLAATRTGGVFSRSLKAALKVVRSSQPFNFLATTTVRSVMRLLGLHSERVVKHLHRLGGVRSRLPNGRTLRLWSRADDWVSNQVFWRGWEGYEPETVPLFFRLATRARLTLDVGAYVGFYSLLAGHANPQGKVVAFEPLPPVFGRLKANVALNALENVECVPAAVGDAEGNAEFFHCPGGIPCSSSLSLEFMRSAPSLTSTHVPVRRLDRFLAEKGLGPVDLMKIDTESTEPQVLRGLGALLARERPLIFCEVLLGRGSEQALADILGPLGYHFYLLTPSGPEPRNRVEGHPDWLNYLFTHLPPEEVARW